MTGGAVPAAPHRQLEAIVAGEVDGPNDIVGVLGLRDDGWVLVEAAKGDYAGRLVAIAARLDKDRRDTARLVAGPDRKTVRDW